MIKVGETYGAWLVKRDMKKGQRFQCLCTICGIKKQIIRAHDLKTGRSKMCRSCSVGANKSSHGMSDTQEYNSWVHIIQRCTNPKNKDYENYGGRGITICDLWRNSFEAFYMDVGPKPTPEHTIERIDYEKGYEPGNVKWATRQEQVLNKRDNVNLTIDGVTKTVSQWARESGVSEFVIYKRCKRNWLKKYGEYATVFTPSGEEPCVLTKK